MATHAKSRLVLPGLILVLTLATVSTAHAELEGGRSLFALNVIDLNLDIDTTMDIAGETHFFSSRPNRYLGGRITAHTGGATEKLFSIGPAFGIVWGKSSYLLNWEEPGLRSFPPLEASITTVAMPIGMDFNLRLAGFLTISPYLTTKLMLLRMNLEIDNEDFSGSAFKLGLDAGLKVAVDVGSIRVAAGAGLTHIVNDEIEFEVEDLTFDSKTSGSSPEYFLGVEVQ